MSIRNWLRNFIKADARLAKNHEDADTIDVLRRALADWEEVAAAKDEKIKTLNQVLVANLNTISAQALENLRLRETLLSIYHAVDDSLKKEK